MLRSILFYTGIGLLFWWVCTQPDAAAHVVKGIGHILGGMATGLGTFATKLTS